MLLRGGSLVVATVAAAAAALVALAPVEAAAAAADSGAGGAATPKVHLRQQPSGERVFVDEYGRERIFHGTNVITKGRPWYPTRDKYDAFTSLVKEDFELMKSVGINSIRRVQPNVPQDHPRHCRRGSRVRNLHPGRYAPGRVKRAGEFGVGYATGRWPS